MTKTCGECKHFANFGCNKIKNCGFVSNTNIACCLAEWKNPTNGDKIRQMSNKNLAIFLGDRVYCFTCPTKGVPCFDKPKDVCYQKWLAWLNAPAVCVAQNAKNDTQTDLCCTDNTQDQEAKDER
jgi:hypothetical protein